MSSLAPDNEFVLKAQNTKNLQLSVRLLEYLNLYTLKRDEIVYQCPIYKSEIEDEDFQLEVQCVEEMGDLGIFEKWERRREFAGIRELESKEQGVDEKSGGIWGKVASIFTGKSQSKSKSKLTPQRRSLNKSAMKSSIYSTKMTTDQTLLSKSKQKSKLASSQYKPQPRPNNQVTQSVVSVMPIAPKSPKQPKPQPQPMPSPVLQQKSSEIFNEESLEEINEDDLPNADDSISSKSMPKIEEDEAESIVSGLKSIRDSRVSRVSVEDREQRGDREGTGRRSKRVKVESQEDEKEEEKKVDERKEDAFKKSEKKVETATSLTKKVSNISTKSSKGKKLQKQSSKPSKSPPLKPKTSHKPAPKPEQFPQLVTSIIEQQISRLSAISNREGSSVYSMLSSADFFDQSELRRDQIEREKEKQKQKEKEEVQDSYSDIKIDWFAKIEACELQETLLMNRMKNLWSRPILKSLQKLQNLHLINFTQQISNNPRYKWTRPNLNFGRVIE